MSVQPISPEVMPRLPHGVRLTESAEHGGWVLLGPDQVFKADAIAVAVLERCSGTATFAAILDDLSKHYNAPTERIEKDIAALLRSLVEKRLLEL